MTTLFRVVALTDSAKEWVNDNVSEEGYQPQWPTLFVEHRYLDDLIEGMQGTGLTVSMHNLQAAGVC